MNTINNHDQEKIETLLGQARRVCEAAEVFLITTEELPIHLEANQIKSIHSSQSQAVALRVFKNGRIGYATGNGLTDAKILVKMATEAAAFGPRADFVMPAPASYPAPDIYDADVSKITLKTMIAQAQGMADDLVRQSPGLICEGGVSRDVVTISIANSSGLTQSYTRTEYSLAIGGVLTRGTDMLFVGDEASSCHEINSSAPLIKNVLRQLQWSSQTVSVTTGKLPVIFMPYGITSALLAPLTAGLNGKLVLEKASPLTDKGGRKLMDTKFSLISDATMPGQPSSHPFDDEGVPSRHYPLIKNGTIAGFYYDLRTAAMAKKKSTGHGRRGSGQPAPTLGALVIPAGQTSLSDMIADIKEGLVIEQVMGATQGNVLAGDFSGNVLLGYKIENGRIVGRVKDTVVSGNVYAMLKEIVSIGSEAQWAGGILTPPIFFPALSVASTG